MNTDILKTKEVNVFDFSAAISNGKAVDNKGNTHEIITHSSEFLITSSHLGEACFDKTGTQQATFQKARLTQPSRVKVKLLNYVIYNKKTMTVLDMQSSYTSTSKYDDEDNVECLNITHLKSKEILAELGITKTEWYK